MIKPSSSTYEQTERAVPLGVFVALGGEPTHQLGSGIAPQRIEPSVGRTAGVLGRHTGKLQLLQLAARQLGQPRDGVYSSLVHPRL